MKALADELQAALDGQDAFEQLDHLRQLEDTLASLRRQLAEVEGRIPLWDKLIFWSDTADEAERNELQAEITRRRDELATHNKTYHGSLEQVGRSFPPFSLGVRLAKCLQLIHENVQVESGLFPFSSQVIDIVEVTRLLESLGEQIKSYYFSDFDQELLLRRIATKEDCQREARSFHEESFLNDYSGYSPIDTEDLIPLVAQKLLDEVFFDSSRQLAKQLEEHQELSIALKKAKGQVPLLDKLNIFSDSPAEKLRDDLEKDFVRSAHRLQQSTEELQLHITESLKAYPPMGLYQAVGSVLAVLRSLEPDADTTISAGGRVVSNPVAAPGVLLQVSIRELKSAFLGLFGELPLVHELLKDSIALQPSICTKSLQDIFVYLDEHDAEKWVKKGLVHATMKGQLIQRKREVQSEISWLDRMVFWSDTTEETKEKEYKERAAWHKSALGACWHGLLEMTEQAGRAQLPFLLRDFAINATHRISSIHTSSLESGMRKTCSVYGRKEARQALNNIRKLLEEQFGFGGTRENMMAELVQYLREHPEREEICIQDKRKIQLQELKIVMANQLRGSGFVERFENLQDAKKRRRKVRSSSEEVATRISIWDRINILSKTPAQEEEDVLEEEINELSSNIREELDALNELFEVALEAYPPALLYYMMGGVYHAVSQIRAVCRSKTVRTGTGKDRRTETRYYCELRGKTRALHAMAAWCEMMVRVYGELPGYHSVLEAWASGMYTD